MTLGNLVVNIGIVAVVFTVGLYFLKKDSVKSLLMSFLQNFCGVLFIFSGWVKAIDPLGTAYKMEQYFDEFYYTFEPTWFGFLAPLFPVFSKYAIWFSVFMIVFEIVLGIMLLLGIRNKFTSWAFLLLVAFFTVLTGFTFLTGYVPSDANFFQFGKWTAFNANNMKVTDCGCFGDFIKLEPKVSFLKDVFLMFPAIFFVLREKWMHKLLKRGVSNIVIDVSIVVLLIYCFSNYVWDLPHIDFRPFKKGADVAAIREAEENAMAAVQITAWELENNETGEVITVPNDEYMSNYTSRYKGAYSVLEQVKGEPAIKPTKISDFEVTSLEGYDISYDFLDSEEPLIMIVNYALKGDPEKKTRMVKDSVFHVDTTLIFDSETYQETITTAKELVEVRDKEEDYIVRNWNKAYIEKHTEKIKPLSDAAKADGMRVIMVVGKADPPTIMDFDEATGLDIEYGMADDILLKTIVRSNPGVVLWKDGKILDKWHIKQLPDYEKIKAEHLGE